MGHFPRRWTVFIAVVVGLIALGLIRRESTREPSWPAPARDYNQERIDYDGPRFPQARVVAVPTINLSETADLPLPIEVPNTTASHPLVFEGIVQHPLPVMGGHLHVRITAPPNSPQSRFNTDFDLVNLTGTNGRLPFRVEGRVPGGKGSFEVEIEVKALSITGDVSSGLVTTVVAKGTILVE